MESDFNEKEESLKTQINELTLKLNDSESNYK